MDELQEGTLLFLVQLHPLQFSGYSISAWLKSFSEFCASLWNTACATKSCPGWFYHTHFLVWFKPRSSFLLPPKISSITLPPHGGWGQKGKELQSSMHLCPISIASSLELGFPSFTMNTSAWGLFFLIGVRLLTEDQNLSLCTEWKAEKQTFPRPHSRDCLLPCHISRLWAGGAG